MCINCTWTVATVGLTLDTSCHKKGFSWMQITPLMQAKLGKIQGPNDLSLSFLCPITLCHQSFNSHARILQLNRSPCAHGPLDWQWRWVLKSPEWRWDLKPVGSTCQDLMHGPPAFWLVVRIVFIKTRVVTPSITTKDVHKTTKLHTGGHYNNISIYIIII